MLNLHTNIVLDENQKPIAVQIDSDKHAPSLTTLKKYAQAVGCHLEIKLVPKSRPTKRLTSRAKKVRAR